MSMKIKSDDKIIVPYTYIFNTGSFGKVIGKERIDQNTIRIRHGELYSCRDRFHWYVQKPDEILFIHEPEEYESIVKFVNKVEKKLGNKILTTFKRTNVSKVSLVKIAKFWRLNEARRSLFTILLRAGREQSNITHAVLNDDYLCSTKNAFKLFLKGYTHVKKNKISKMSGWVNTFHHRSEQRVKEILSKR